MRWRLLLRPGWVALTVVVLGFATACFVVLAPWQFQRGEDRTARNSAIEDSFTTPAAPLRDVLAAGAEPGTGTEWRQVSLTGRFLPAGETVVRLRSVQGEPAFEVLVPMRLTDGTAVLVDRGYVRPDADVRLPGYPPVPGGEVTVTGRLRVGESDPRAGESVQQDGATQVYSVSTATVSAVTGVALEPGYVQLADGTPGVLGPLPLPQLSSGPHLAYALQWLAFGAMVLVGLGYFGWRELTGGRAPREVEPVGQRADDPHDAPIDRDPPVGRTLAQRPAG